MNARPPACSHDAIAVPILLAAVLGVFGAVTPAVVYRVGMDYPPHLRLAQLMAETGAVASPHFVYHIAVMLTAKLVPGLDIRGAGCLVVVLAYLALSLVLYVVLRRTVAEVPPRRAPWLAAGATLGLMLVSAVTVLTWKQRNLYFGYIGINVYHNPTILLLKPFALAIQCYAIRAFTPPGGQPVAVTLVCAVLVVLSALTKPSYLIALLPAVTLLAMARGARQETVDWRLLLLGITVPAVLVLAWQYAARFTDATLGGSPSGIVLAPFAVFGARSTALLPKFLLSVLFPLVVYGLDWRRAGRDLPLNLAWLVFGAGATMTYLLAEANPRTGAIDLSGNFAWSGQITGFLLFVATMVFFLRQSAAVLAGAGEPGARRKFVAGAAVFGLHLASGLVWYATHILADSPSDLWW